MLQASSAIQVKGVLRYNFPFVILGISHLLEAEWFSDRVLAKDPARNIHNAA